MRRLLPLLLLTLLLPGCVLAIGNEGLDGKKGLQRLERLERRVSELEHQLAHSDGYVDDDYADEDYEDADDHDGPAMRP